MTQVFQEGGSRSVFYSKSTHVGGDFPGGLSPSPRPSKPSAPTKQSCDQEAARGLSRDGDPGREGRPPWASMALPPWGGPRPDTYWKLIFQCRRLCESSTRVPCTGLCCCCGCICGPEECRTLHRDTQTCYGPEHSHPRHSHHRAWRGNSGVHVVGFVTFLIVHHTNLTLKLRSGIYWVAEQNNAKLMTQNNAGSSNDEGDNTPPRSGAL